MRFLSGKFLLAMFILLLPVFLYSQNKEVEQANLLRLREEGELNDEQFRSYARQWTAMLDELGGYPVLPFNEETQRIEFTFIEALPGLDKEKIYLRILEWAAINFGSLKSVLHYENLASGKLIMKGSFLVPYKSYWNFFGEKSEWTERKAFETFVFTIKDEKLKIEVIGLEFEIAFFSDSSLSKNVVPINYYIPITNAKPIDWKERLSIITNTERKLKFLMASLKEYIQNHNKDYSF